jgi:hypothetical protein
MPAALDISILVDMKQDCLKGDVLGFWLGLAQGTKVHTLGYRRDRGSLTIHLGRERHIFVEGVGSFVCSLTVNQHIVALGVGV